MNSLTAKASSLIPLLTLSLTVSLPAATLLVDHTFDGVANDTGGPIPEAVSNFLAIQPVIRWRDQWDLSVFPKP